MRHAKLRAWDGESIFSWDALEEQTKPYRHTREYPKMDGEKILIAIHNAAAQGYDRLEIELKTFNTRPVRIGPITKNKE